MYLIIFKFLLCAFKIILMKGIVYIQCKRWVIKLSFKWKALGEFMSTEIVLSKEEFYA